MKKKFSNFPSKEKEENSSSSDISDDFDDNEEHLNNNNEEEKITIDAESEPSTCERVPKITALKKLPAKKKKANNKKLRIIFNIADTKYDVVKYVGRKIFKWKITSDNEAEWDILWTDNAVQPEQLAKMQLFQKINHFPGMYSLARKNHLARNLMRMRKNFPDQYKFFPPTWLLPAEYCDFRAQFNKKTNKTFIVKPEASCQGRGIFLTRNYEDVEPTEHYVAQRYIHKPYLIDGLKFDCRLYVLLAGCDPLRIYLYNEGLGRFATEEYVVPSKDNLENVCMHLTNYAINKDNPNFVFNENEEKNDVGHKRSFTATLHKNGADIPKLMDEIKRIIIKTFCSVQPVLSHNYKSCQPESFSNNMCFEILGIDILIDHKLKPWLLEVNHTPSFTTDTPLDRKIKKNVIKDALTLMNISLKHKIKHKSCKKLEFQQRVITGKKLKLTHEEKQKIIENSIKERDEYENNNLGGYTKLFPFGDESEKIYDDFIKYAQKMWEEWTGANIRRNSKKQDEKSVEKNNNQKNMTAANLSNKKLKTSEIEKLYSQKITNPLLLQKTNNSNSKKNIPIKKNENVQISSPNMVPTKTEITEEIENLNNNNNNIIESQNNELVVPSSPKINEKIDFEKNGTPNTKNNEFRIKTKLVATPPCKLFNSGASYQEILQIGAVQEVDPDKKQNNNLIVVQNIKFESNLNNVNNNKPQSMHNIDIKDKNYNEATKITLKNNNRKVNNDQLPKGFENKQIISYMKEKNLETINQIKNEKQNEKNFKKTNQNPPIITPGNFIIPKVMEFNMNGVLRPEEDGRANMDGFIVKNKAIGSLKNPLMINENYILSNPNIFNVQRHMNFFQNGKK